MPASRLISLYKAASRPLGLLGLLAGPISLNRPASRLNRLIRLLASFIGLQAGLIGLQASLTSQ